MGWWLWGPLIGLGVVGYFYGMGLSGAAAYRRLHPGNKDLWWQSYHDGAKWIAVFWPFVLLYFLVFHLPVRACFKLVYAGERQGRKIGAGS